MTFFKTKTNNPKIFMEPPKTPNSQSNLEEKEQSRKAEKRRGMEQTKLN